MFSSRRSEFSVVIIATLFLLASFSHIITVQAAQASWIVEPVDAANYVGEYCSMKIDSNDHIHIAYYDDYWKDLKYAYFDGSDWLIEPVDHVGNVGKYCSLALDSNNRPHISYFDETNYYLKYAWWNGINWSIATVDNLSGGYTSIAVDSANDPHISYFEYDYGKLKYAYWNGYTWSTQIVDDPITGSGTVGNGSSIALDSSNRPQIAYRSTVPDQLKFAKWNGTVWNIEVVDDLPVLDPSLVIDDYDVPFISYYDVGSANLKYAVWTISLWYKETVDASLNVGRYSSIALDSIGVPHISYYDLYWQDLKYAKNEPGVGWLIRTIDTVGNMGLNGTSIALDSSDHPHISYNDATNHDLKIAKDPDETFSVTGYEGLDTDADLKDDSILLYIDVNTTYSGSIDVSVTAVLISPSDAIVDDDYAVYTITGNQVESNTLTVTVPSGSPEGMYTVKLFLADEMGNPEGTITLDTAAYLYPLAAAPEVGYLQGTVTDFESSLPWQYAQIYLNGIPETDTNSTGQYSLDLTPGNYIIGATDEEGSLYSSEFVNVTIIANATVIQDLQLKRTNWILTIQAEGSGTIQCDIMAEPINAPYLVTYPINSTAQVEAFPAEGWKLDHWRLENESIGASNPASVFMDTNHLLTAVFTEYPTTTSVESCNSAGDQKDYFDLGETVYITGSGYSSSTTYNLYVVADTDWSDSMSIPTRIPGTSNNVTSNTEGVIPATPIWSNPQTIGKYDIVVDVNGNGVYNAGVDALDSSDVEVTAGMVIPEFAPFLFLTFFIMLTLFALFTAKDHHKKGKMK
jgi:hypothetical protein